MFKDIRGAGWTTAQIGKLHWTGGTTWKSEFDKLPDYYSALSLDKVVDVSGPPDSPKAHDAYARYLTSKKLLERVAADLRRRYILWEFDPRASVVGPEDYHDTFVTRTAANFIQEQPKDKPVCLVVSLHSPHPPLDAPGEYATMYKPEDLILPGNVPETFKRENHNIDQAEVRRLLANYLGKISLVDHCIGMLVDAMKTRGTWDNTLVVFTADHGEMMGAHGMLTKGRFYEESARVPLVIRWPGHVESGRTPALAQMFDVYPTIVDAIGGEVSPGRFAKSLLPVATGKRAAVRNLAISEIGDKAPLRMMARNARYKYWADEEREYLFDLENDPLEMHDLSEDAEHRETMNEMRSALLMHLRSTQTNYAAGYKSKVQRMREAAQEKTPQ
jgi:arylsulfatase A-like enzyme